MSQQESGGQGRASRRAQENEADQVEEATGSQSEQTADVAERKEQLDADVDSLLDEIDDVLEENAEEFVRGYVQKGGQ